MHGLPVDGMLGTKVWNALPAIDASPPLVDYQINMDDVAGLFVPQMPKDYSGKTSIGLAYREAAENQQPWLCALDELECGAAFEAGPAWRCGRVPRANSG
jgi:hypothetical protein